MPKRQNGRTKDKPSIPNSINRPPKDNPQEPKSVPVEAALNALRKNLNPGRRPRYDKFPRGKDSRHFLQG